MFNNILLCTHGSQGARSAENYVFSKLASVCGTDKISVLTIIDSDWSSMSSDDWLNTSTTRTVFKDYVEEQLNREIDEEWQRIKKQFPDAEKSRFLRVVGPIEETMAEVASRLSCDVLVTGPRLKKGSRLFSVTMEKGLADSLSNKKLHPKLPCPLMTVPLDDNA